MDWIVLSSDKTTIENLIVADQNFADAYGCVTFYDGAEIGAAYNPPLLPAPLPTEPQLLGQQITDEQLARIELGQRQTDIELSILGGTQHV